MHHALNEMKIKRIMSAEGLRYEQARRVMQDRASVAERIRRDRHHGTRWGKEF